MSKMPKTPSHRYVSSSLLHGSLFTHRKSDDATPHSSTALFPSHYTVSPLLAHL